MIDEFQAHRNKDAAYKEGKRDGIEQERLRYQKLLRYIEELYPFNVDIIELKALANLLEEDE